MTIGSHNLTAAPIILAVVVIGLAIYFIARRRRKRE
ncbi:MAG TPA: LPXTG cell wall anchor domain-containing protein [Streptosporangiaceae bacterium]|jgi:LPXTG-motif cell wall-anchored protein